MARFINYFSKLLLSCFAIAAFSSCRHAEEPNEDWCLTDDYKADVLVSASVDKAMFNHVNFDIDEPETRGTSMQLRYTAWIFRQGDTKPYASASSFSPKFVFQLPLGKFKAVLWADYVPCGIDKDFYFFTDDPDEMLLVDKVNYKGSDFYKMAFSNDADFTVSYKTPEIGITLKPQMAQYKIAASDTPDYEVGKIRVSYPKTVPAAIHAVTRQICYNWADVGYNHDLGKSEISDNVFANDAEQNLSVKLEVYDTDGKLRARRYNLPIPIIKGGVTIAHAKIYSVLEPDPDAPDNPDKPDKPGGGGIGINPDFDYTFEIFI